jgi:alkanesulfonate monooxygenase SsuD/methylene tetrahydromethanopterin reductase-like flavin-dependent oxidoreductase (luciferase family)
MAATLQEVSGGRVLLGLGAGGGRDTPYASEQLALGRPVPPSGARRKAVEQQIAVLRSVWSGATGGAGGFLRPEPAPPVIVGGFGPKMADLAGRVGDGINTPGGPGLERLLNIARDAHERSGRPSETFVATASASGSARERDRLAALGVNRMIVGLRPRYVDGVAALQRNVL